MSSESIEPEKSFLHPPALKNTQVIETVSAVHRQDESCSTHPINFIAEGEPE